MNSTRRLLLTCSEAARLLSMGRTKVYAMAASGELPIVRIGRRAVRIPASGLEEWITQNTRKPDGDGDLGRAQGGSP